MPALERLDGMMVEAERKSPTHAVAVLSLSDLVRNVLPPGWHLRIEQPVTLGDSEPESDLAIVVEVAASTLERDRTTKRRIYARAGIPFYLLLDLKSRRLFSWRPDHDQPETYTDADEFPVWIGGHEVGRIAVSSLLP